MDDARDSDVAGRGGGRRVLERGVPRARRDASGLSRAPRHRPVGPADARPKALPAGIRGAKARLGRGLPGRCFDHLCVCRARGNARGSRTVACHRGRRGGARRRLCARCGRRSRALDSGRGPRDGRRLVVRNDDDRSRGPAPRSRAVRLRHPRPRLLPLVARVRAGVRADARGAQGSGLDVRRPTRCTRGGARHRGRRRRAPPVVVDRLRPRGRADRVGACSPAGEPAAAGLARDRRGAVVHAARMRRPALRRGCRPSPGDGEIPDGTRYSERDGGRHAREPDLVAANLERHGSDDE